MTAVTLTDPASAQMATDRWRFGQYFLLFTIIVGCFIAFDLIDGQLHNGDPDDVLRAIEVRTFLQTGNWYDMTMPMVRQPEPYLSPWSRLVDLPYAALTLALRTVIGPEQAIHMAFQIWPPLMAVLFSLLSIAVLRRIAPLKAQLPVSLLIGVIILMPYAIWEFSPGRIDHHSVQILLLLSIAYGLTRFDAMGGLIIGAAVPAAMAIGLETLPVLAVVLAALPVAWWFDLRGSDRVLQYAGIACVTATLALTVVLIAPSGYFTLHSDSFSAPYIEALVGYGVLAVLLPVLLPGDGAPVQKFAAFAGLGLVVIVGIVLQYPDLRHGPFPMIDAVAHRYWFDRIHQEMTALLFFRIGDWTAVALIAAMFAILILAAPSVLCDARRREAALPMLYAFAIAVLVMTCISNRFLRLALAIVPLLLPIAVGEAIRMIQASRTRTAMFGKGMGIVAAFGVAITGLAIAVPEKTETNDAFDYLLMRDCRTEDFSAVARIAPASIMTPPAIGLQIIRHAPQGIAVSSIPFHRASYGLSRVLRTFMAATAAERMTFLKDFDYLAVCRSPRGLPGEQSLPLFAALMADRKVPGLERVALPQPSEIMLFRIDKSLTK